MDTGDVEKFFCKPEETQKKPIEVDGSLTSQILFSYGNSTRNRNAYPHAAVFQDMDDMDLDMLAPYISMDEDFQLTFLPQLPEAETQTDVSTTASKKR